MSLPFAFLRLSQLCLASFHDLFLHPIRNRLDSREKKYRPYKKKRAKGLDKALCSMSFCLLNLRSVKLWGHHIITC